LLARRALAVVLIAAMGAFGYGVYRYLGHLKSSSLLEKARAPHKTQQFVLPGTLVIEQGGALYRLQGGVFTQIANGGWMQPTVTPDRQHLVAVKRAGNVSDIFQLDLNGQVQRQLTSDSSRRVELNHWAFYPSLSPDGGTLYYSWDQKDVFNNFRVDLSVYAMPLGGIQRQARPWTVPNKYTGGDVQAIASPGGGIIYTKYDIDPQGKTVSQLWTTTRALALGKALTAPTDDCSQGTLSPDGSRLAMICTSGTQVARLEVAHFDGRVLGPPQVIAQGALGVPAWSADGNGLVYLGTVQPSGHFQLFYVNLTPPPAPSPTPIPSPEATPQVTAPSPTPTPPVSKQLTTDNDFDATSAPIWF
jgi:Tol biopolymer transport system component